MGSLDLFDLFVTPTDRTEHGSSMIEFCVVGAALLMLANLMGELTYWHFTRQYAALALSEAVDQSTLHHGDESVTLWHLQTKLPHLNIQASDLHTQGHLEALFKDFADPVLSQQYGQPTVRHDFLNAQYEQHLQKGWLGGRGPASGQTILQANTLQMVLRIRHRPYLLWFRSLMQFCCGQGYVTITVKQSALMQSHRFKPLPHVMHTFRPIDLNEPWQSRSQPQSRGHLSLQGDLTLQAGKTRHVSQQALTPPIPLTQPLAAPYLPLKWKPTSSLFERCEVGATHH